MVRAGRLPVRWAATPSRSLPNPRLHRLHRPHRCPAPPGPRGRGIWTPYGKMEPYPAAMLHISGISAALQPAPVVIIMQIGIISPIIIGFRWRGTDGGQVRPAAATRNRN